MTDLQQMLMHQARLFHKSGSNALGDLFENACSEIERLKERVAEIQGELEGAAFSASCFDIDVLTCLNKMAYEHNASEIPRYREKALRCAGKISQQENTLTRFIKERKIEAVRDFSNSYCDDEHCFLAEKYIKELE